MRDIRPSLYNWHPNKVIAMAAILVMATCLRVFHLDYQSLWNDELHSMNGSDPVKTLGEVIEYCKIDQPPAYFILLHYWFKVFDYNEFSGRLLSVMIGVSGIVVMFFLGKEFKGPRVGLVASFITAINYFHIYYSQEVRFYSLLFLATAFSYWMLFRSFRTKRLVDLGLYCLATSAVIYTHYFGLVVFASQAIMTGCVLLIRKDFKLVFRFVFCFVLISLLVSPWIPIFVKDNSTTEFWIQPVTFRFFFACYYSYFRDFVSSKLFALLVLYFLIKILPGRLRGSSIEFPQYVVLLGSLALSLLIPLIYSLVKMPILISRYTIIVLPGLLLLISLSIESLKPYLKRPILALVLVSSLVSLIVIEKFYTSIRNEQLREAAAWLKTENKYSTFVFSDHAWHFNFYLRKNKTTLAHEPWTVDYRSILDKRDSVYVLSAGDVFWGPLKKDLASKDFIRSQGAKFYHAKTDLYIKRKKSNTHL